ncbi:PREDICTED: uncharacterized protein LOC105561902 [Vollenhovia emeryi]|uniref:uncharacterized protein LOC105561902 n=1 Tax=Vollenhovia emeryi TaxID=411798 RepID=UPI0005F40B56|nr:PREDICTED: uncharacterized protein LOC105561902 [Vollenhovia emeryi]
MSDEDMNCYVIVRFTDENSISSKILDLVPRSWLRDDCSCFYPNPCDYQYMKNCLLSLKKPEEHWESFSIEVIAYAKDLKQGKRRLKRALKSDKIKCTDDDEHQRNECEPNKCSRNTIAQTLNAVKPFQSYGSFTQKCQPKTKTNPNVCPMDEEAEEVLPILEETAIDIINVPSNDVIVTKEYADQKFEELQEKVLSQIASAKRSILYDLDKKITELKHTILLNNLAGNMAPGGVEKVKADLKNFNDFRSEKRLIGKSFLISIICISISIMTKAVELHYSGTGKIINGQGKRNFSSTNTYLCSRDVLIDKFGDAMSVQKLPGQVGIWLS